MCLRGAGGGGARGKCFAVAQRRGVQLEFVEEFRFIGLVESILLWQSKTLIIFSMFFELSPSWFEEEINYILIAVIFFDLKLYQNYSK